MTYDQLLKKLSNLNPLELEEEVVVVNQNTKAIFALHDFRIATNHLMIGPFRELDHLKENSICHIPGISKYLE